MYERDINSEFTEGSPRGLEGLKHMMCEERRKTGSLRIKKRRFIVYSYLMGGVDQAELEKAVIG